MPVPHLPPKCKSLCILPDDLAAARKELFTGTKVKVLDAQVPDKKEHLRNLVDLDRFVELITSFTKNKSYNGIRIYFASCLDSGGPHVPPGKEGHLTVIIAPTTPPPSGGKDGGNDDPDQYYHLYDICPPLPNPNTAAPSENAVANWKKHFMKNRRPKLVDDGAWYTGIAEFDETNSLWYPMSTFRGGGSDMGMLGSIACGKNYSENPLVGLTIEFACFTQYESEPVKYPFYQLTLTFDLHQKNDPLNGLFTFGSLSPLTFTDADTGLPCPPSNTCPPPTTTFLSKEKSEEMA